MTIPRAVILVSFFKNTEEHRKKISESQMGRIVSDETRRRISKAKRKRARKL